MYVRIRMYIHVYVHLYGTFIPMYTYIRLMHKYLHICTVFTCIHKYSMCTGIYHIPVYKYMHMYMCSHSLCYCVHTSGGFLLMSFSGVVRRIGRELVILAGFISHMISFLLVFYTVPDDATAHLQPTAEVYLIDRQL